MLPLLKNDRKAQKCLFTYTPPIPHVFDSNNTPTRKKPFSTLSDLEICYNIILLLPNDGDGDDAEVLSQLPASIDCAPGHWRVSMSLLEIIQGEFFNTYIKTGNIAMLSDKNDGANRRYSLYEGMLTNPFPAQSTCLSEALTVAGVLRLELDKGTYERCGLQGKSMYDGGQKHKQNRFVVELKLREPSMVHGKKGFSRIEWTFKNVLTEKIDWLFLDFRRTKEGMAAPILKFKPSSCNTRPNISILNGVMPMKDFELCSSTAEIFSDPDLKRSTAEEDDFLQQIEEYISLLAVGSPRVMATDRIDPYICKYSVPTFTFSQRLGGDKSSSDQQQGNTKGIRITMIRWTGLFSSDFLHQVLQLAQSIASNRKSNYPVMEADWFALNIASSRKGRVTLLKPVSKPIKGKSNEQRNPRLLEWFYPPRAPI